MDYLILDEIAHGNPNYRDRQMMLKEGYLDRLLPILYKMTPPPNSSAATQNELKKLMSYANKEQSSKNTLYDQALLDVIKNHFIAVGANEEFVTTVTNGIADDVIPLLTKLKYYFNRPRPLQLAYYYGMEFYPDFSFFTNNPSYPSGHTTLTAVTCHVLGNLYPENYESINKVIQEAMDSRVFLGVHYPSDNDMAMYVAKQIIDNAEFKTKYRL